MLRQFVIQTSRRLNMIEGQDYLCEAGLQSLTIAANGDIYPLSHVYSRQVHATG